MPHPHRVVVAILAGAVCCAPADTSAAGEKITFEKNIRPILKAHCFQCHGEGETVKAKLDLRLRRFVAAGGDSGPAIESGKPDESLLIERIEAGEMPPGDKRLSKDEIALLRRWITEGAITARPEPETITDETDLTDEDRDYWAFRPISRPAVPTVQATDRVRTPIDAFLQSRLEREKLGFSAEADKITLLRRASFDLVGLPPTAEQADRFLADDAPDAYESLVDRLLESPQYGERWGRHWLDVAGYADSDGYSEKDLERKYAWKYRDYVIRAFNDDKPWNEFIVEQLAGDELLTPPYVNLAPEQAEKLIATGFLRMGPDGTGDGAVDQKIARHEAIAETIKIVSTSLLGMTVGCAQCHNHRYDPITQADYYRMRAIFEPAFDTTNWRAPTARLVSLWSEETKQKAKEVDAELATLAEERKKILEQIVEETLESEIAKLPEELREPARAARATPVKERTEEQKKLLKEHPSLNVNSGSVYLYDRKRVDQHNKKYDALQAEIQAKRPQEEFAHCLTEIPGKAPATHLFFRGDINQPRQEVTPGELTVLCASSASPIPVDDTTIPTTGRRLAYARHLTNGKHPLVARVLVNRVWLHHFGQGLVANPGDFGVLGSPPSHPELLDWLADEFMSGGWRLKSLHRLIMNSTAYRQSSRRTEALNAVDPENALLGRMNVRRLEAETVRDAVLAVSGRLSRKMLGPPVPVTPDEVGQIIVGVDTRDSAGRPSGKVVPLGEDEFRRSLYVQSRRTTPLSMLESFDAPDMKPNCTKRNNSTVAPQSLLFMNNDFVVAQAGEFARSVYEFAGDDAAAQIRVAWQRTFTRLPDDAQLQAGLDFLAVQKAEWETVEPPNAEKPPAVPAIRRALTGYCQALLSSNPFLYVD